MATPQPAEAAHTPPLETTPLLGREGTAEAADEPHDAGLVETYKRWKRDRSFYLGVSRILTIVLIIAIVLVGGRWLFFL